MPQIHPSINQALFDKLETYVPEYSSLSQTIEDLLAEAVRWREFPNEDQLVSFGNYLLSDEREEKLQANKDLNPDRLNVLRWKVHIFDLYNWNAKTHEEKMALISKTKLATST